MRRRRWGSRLPGKGGATAASVYRPKGQGKYVAQYRGADGAVHRVTLGRDKNASLARAVEIERKVERERAGLADPHEAQAKRPIAEHLDDFLASLADRQRSKDYAALMATRIRAILDGTRVRAVSDLRPSSVEAFLGDLATQGRGRKTLAHYAAAIKGFTRWLLRDGRIGCDPLASLEPVPLEGDRKRVRRALDEHEQRRLIQAAETSERSSFDLTGRDRAMIYRLVLTTGLRANELATLTAGSLSFGDGQGQLAGSPTVTVAPKNAKNRKLEPLPLRRDVADALRAYVGIRPATALVFPKTSWADHGTRMMTPDLEAAGIPYKTADGVVDLHALRHSFITGLARAGVPPQIAQRLARHSDVRLTLGVYSHLGLVDLAGAIAKLPGLDPSPDRGLATGTGNVRANLSLPGAFSGENVPSRETRGPEKGNLGIALGASAGAPVQAAASGRGTAEEIGAPGFEPGTS